MIFFAILAAAKEVNTHPPAAIVPPAATVGAEPSRPAAPSVPPAAARELSK